MTLAGEVALQNRIVAVGHALDQLRIAADAAGFSDLALFRKAMPSIKSVPQLIAEVEGHLAEVNRTWDRVTREKTVIQSDLNAPADWADWQARAAGLDAAQRAFSGIAGDQSISSFIQETQRKVNDEQFLNAVKTFAVTLVLTIATSGIASAVGRGVAGMIGTGSMWRAGAAFVVDAAINASINTALQLALDPKASIGLTMLENSITEVLTRGLMKGVQRLQKTALAEARSIAQLPHLSAAERRMFATMQFTGVDLTADVVGGFAAQWVARKIKHEARDQLKSKKDKEADAAKPWLHKDDEPFAATVFQQGASIGLGKFFHGRYNAWKQHRAELSKSNLGTSPEAKALIAAREQFYREAKQLAESLSPDPNAGDVLAQTDVALIAQERALAEASSPVAATAPVAIESPAVALAQLAPPPDMMFDSYQRSRAERLLTEMPPAQLDEFAAILDATPDPVAKAFLFKGLAHRSSHAELRWLAGEMAGKDRGWLIDNLTLSDPRGVGGGVTQQWCMSCNASMAITWRGNIDPVYALRVRRQNPSVGDVNVTNPRAMNAHQAGLEKLMLETSYAGANPNSSHGHRGVATPRAAQDGVGRFADDLLNLQAASSGLTYAPLVNPSSSQVLAILDLSLGAGMQVPLVLGTAFKQQAHYVLVQRRRVSGPSIEYNVHDPATGESTWMAATDIEHGAFPHGFNRVGTIEVPTAIVTTPAGSAGSGGTP